MKRPGIIQGDTDTLDYIHNLEAGLAVCAAGPWCYDLDAVPVETDVLILFTSRRGKFAAVGTREDGFWTSNGERMDYYEILAWSKINIWPSNDTAAKE